MTEAEALDMAAKAAGWEDWAMIRNSPYHSEGIRAHAKTIMENAALKAEIERMRNAMVVMDNTVREMEAARTQGWNEAIDAAADWFADRFSDAVQADCESGVKWLNERAAKAYLKDAPDTLAAIREGEEAIRALTKDSTHD